MARTKYTKVVARGLLVFLLSNFSMAGQVCILCLPFPAPYMMSSQWNGLWPCPVCDITTLWKVLHFYIIRVFGLGLGLWFTPGCVLGLFVFVLCLVYPINIARAVSVDCPFIIALSIFSDLYFITIYKQSFKIIIQKCIC